MTPGGRGGLRRARPAWAGLVLGVVLTVVPGVSWVAGADPRPAPAAPPQPALAAPAREPVGDRLAAPGRVRFPGSGVDAPVLPVGVDARGGMEVPVDVHTIGWYRFGPAPGAAAGSSVLAGHVDDAVQGRGAFHRLAELAVGDAVQVELTDGTVLEHRVTRVERVAKEQLPVDRLFARSGPPRLTLVTCGGPFRTEQRSYRDNVVVTAEPVP